MWGNPKVGGYLGCLHDVKGLQFFNRNRGGHQADLI